MTTATEVPVYCYQCVAGPDLLKVVVRDDVAVGVEPNGDVAAEHPACGKVCVRAYGLIQKLYNPARIRQPMRRTNPKKGRHEDPGWTPISWEEALDELRWSGDPAFARATRPLRGGPRAMSIAALGYALPGLRLPGPPAARRRA